MAFEDFTEVRVAVMIDRVYIPVLVVLGMVGNVLSFLTLVLSTLRRTSTCVYMAAIALFDCVILMLDLCVLARGYVGHTRFYLGSDWACGFHYFLFYFCIHVDVLLVLAMTADRFLVVKFPFKAQRVCTPGSSVKVIATLCVLSFALNGHIMFTRRLGPSGDAEDRLNCVYPDPTVDFYMKKVYTWIDASIYSFIPFLILLVFNILIIRQVRTSRKFRKQYPQHSFKTSVRLETLRQRKQGDSATDTSCSSTSCQDITDTKQHDTRSQRFASKSTKASQHSTSVISSPRVGVGRNPAPVSGTSRSDNASITAMLLVVSFTFLLLTSPVVVLLLYKRYYWLPSTGGQKAQARLLHAFADNLMYTNHAVNFLLYCLSGNRFRSELKRILLAVCCSCRR